MKAILIGGTGLTGSHLLTYLLNNPLFTEVLSISRQSAGFSHPKLQELIIDLNELAQHRQQLKGDHYFSCLGTTIKKAGSRKKFREVDFAMPYALALIAKFHQGRSFSVISAKGASASSPIFYNQVKGELEEKLRSLDFKTLLIYRPGLLRGERSEQRLAEDLAGKIIKGLAHVIPGKTLSRFTTEAKTLAQVMNENSHQYSGVHFFESEDIYSLASPSTAGK